MIAFCSTGNLSGYWQYCSDVELYIEYKASQVNINTFLTHVYPRKHKSKALFSLQLSTFPFASLQQIMLFERPGSLQIAGIELIVPRHVLLCIKRNACKICSFVVVFIAKNEVRTFYHALKLESNFQITTSFYDHDDVLQTLSVEMMECW